MLEARNITRTYKPKKGSEVRALNNVSLKFPQTGMVFLLGKSGSGKSTLLNLLGGLDKYDEGDILINGKSSLNFNQNEFDSYRNTYLGFIFQEYNILDDFTVNENIALALQLQNKKATKEAINEILEEVDLIGLGDRKPGELSGGQKQRVAIARALVKNPKIILADEPTGALDSKTGIQVFDTLKKLAKEKLVIIVTHDREYAEFYGDRVIELKDGEVISDIEKHMGEPEKLENQMTIVDNKIILIGKGKKLDEKDLKILNQHLENQDALISIDDTLNSDVKKLARIESDGKRKTFKNTDESVIKIDEKENFKLIKSRLPFRNSLKIGASSLKAKPFRLLITILLSMVAFAMFGLADTAGAYNKYKVTKQSFIDSDIKNFSLEKVQEIKYEDYSLHREKKATEEDLKFLNSLFPSMKFSGVYNPLNNNNDFHISNYIQTSGDYWNSAYKFEVSGFFELNEENANFEIEGELPTTYNEIAITTYIYEHFKKYGYNRYENAQTGANALTIKPEDMKNENYFLTQKPTLNFDGEEYLITAIIDTNFDLEEYNSRIEKTDGFEIHFLLQEIEDAVRYGMHSLVFVKKGFKDYYQETKGIDWGTRIGNNKYLYITNEDIMSFSPQKIYSINDIKESNGKYAIFNNKTKLEADEFLINIISYLEYLYYNTGEWSDVWIEQGITRSEITGEANDTMPLWFSEFIFGYSAKDHIINEIKLTGFKKENFKEDVIDMQNDDSSWVAFWNMLYDTPNLEEPFRNKISQWASWNNNNNTPFSDEFSDDELDFMFYNYSKLSLQGYETINYTQNSSYKKYYNDWTQALIAHRRLTLQEAFNSGAILNDFKLNKDYKAHYENYEMDNDASSTIQQYYDVDFKMAGVFMASLEDENLIRENFFYDVYDVVVSDEINEFFASTDDGIYEFLISSMPTSDNVLTKAIKFSYDYVGDKGVTYRMQNSVMSTLHQVNDLLETLAMIFLYIGIGFAVFSALLLTNYIAVSISYKKREIGILRAVGAKSSDVFGIFFNESMIIALINFALAIISVGLVTFFINRILRTRYHVLITFLNFGIRQIGLMLGLSIFVAVVASFLPVYKTARKRPIDAIRK